MHTPKHTGKLLRVARERYDLFNPNPLPMEFFQKPGPKFMYVLDDVVGRLGRKYPEYCSSVELMGDNFEIETNKYGTYVRFKHGRQSLRIERFFANGYACELRALQLQQRFFAKELERTEKKIAELAAKIGPAPP